MRLLFVANWKMNPDSVREAVMLWNATKKYAQKARKTSVVVCPPTPFIASCATKSDGLVFFGAQDVSLFPNGAHTGEVSTGMLKDMHVRYIIAGHSERRALGESNELIARKVQAVLASGLTPILCIGEHERGMHGEHFAFIEEQIRGSLHGISKARAPKIILAYEPLWAIGRTSAQAMSPNDVHEMALFIRKILSKMYGRSVGMSIPILYGGSVEPSNINPIVREGAVQGVLVGHASLVAKNVADMLFALEKAH
ncbi:MAG: triose-phosphate isomerase [Candidatus Campbellbacteria bacterium]|nr:triose-phosphate isomerase [Candidatus Campbellbacteria bacterium]